MNERIRELAEQAEEMCLHAEPWRIMSVCQSADKVWREKFAELIVKECIDVCHNIDKEYDGEDVCAMWCANEISRHFGIE